MLTKHVISAPCWVTFQSLPVYLYQCFVGMCCHTIVCFYVCYRNALTVLKRYQTVVFRWKMVSTQTCTPVYLLCIYKYIRQFRLFYFFIFSRSSREFYNLLTCFNFLSYCGALYIQFVDDSHSNYRLPTTFVLLLITRCFDNQTAAEMRVTRGVSASCGFLSKKKTQKCSLSI